MDLTLIQGAISGLKTASDIAKGMMELKSIADVQTRVIELQSAILNAQSAALSANADQAGMAEEIRHLKGEIERLKRWEVERTRYRLMKPFDGAVAYINNWGQTTVCFNGPFYAAALFAWVPQ